MTRIFIGQPSEKQKRFLRATEKYVGFGGARGGGKSWAVRTKAKLLAAAYPGIRLLIVRRSYPELMNNHIRILRAELAGMARYCDKEKLLQFPNGSQLQFAYCARDKDLDRLQGVEFDVIFLDEATQLSEFQMRSITACLRGVNHFPKRVYFTCNPGGQGHGYIKRLFIDRSFQPGEDPKDYTFIQSLVTDNPVLLKCQPDYVRQLEALPEALRKAWLEGQWDFCQGQFFDDFRQFPSRQAMELTGLSAQELKRQHRFCHVIAPFTPPEDWVVYRSYDWGYGKPFSFGWWAVDGQGVVYRILELYGCTQTPNEGVRWTVERQMEEAARLEREHPWLRGRRIHGVADPAIWDGSRGQSIADTAMHYGLYFTPGVNSRIPGWMQMHYRFAFDENGYAGLYVFDNCRAFIRTIPLLQFDPNRPEDLDTEGEDHVADETRYFCMSRPVRPGKRQEETPVFSDPLDQFKTEKYGRILYA